jgi:hypothetical protein
MPETRFSLIARTVAGGLLLLESLLMLIVGVFGGMIGGLMGALAFLVGGGSATDEQLAQGFAVIAITIASPFVMAAVLAVGGVFILLRRRSGVIIATGIFAVAAQIAFHPIFKERFHAAELVPCVVHLLAIVVGVVFVPAVVANTASA